MAAPTAGQTVYAKFPGIMLWNHLFKPDDFMNTLKYKAQLLVNKDTEEKILSYGLKGEFKDHESGDKLYTFKRDADKIILKKNVSFAPPVIYDANGAVLRQYKYNGEYVTSVNGDVSWDQFEAEGEAPIIGHGSEVIVDICIYGTKIGFVGNRLQSVKIINLVEYIPNSDVGDQQTPAAPKAGGKAPW